MIFWICFGFRFPRFGHLLAVSGETVVIFCISDMEASRYTEYRPILMENRSRYGRFRKFIRNLFFFKVPYGLDVLPAAPFLGEKL